MSKWVIFDMDSTIANISTRKKLATKSGKMDYSILFDSNLITLDQPNLKVVDLLKSLKDFGCKVFILTARPVENINATIEWLEENDIPYDDLRCKPHSSQYQKSDKFKESELHRFLLAYGISPEQVILSVDDDERNIRMFESYGIPTLDPKPAAMRKCEVINFTK